MIPVGPPKQIPFPGGMRQGDDHPLPGHGNGMDLLSAVRKGDAFHLERAQKRKEQRRHNFKELLHKQEVNTCTPDTDPLSWSSHRGDACKEASSSNGSKRVQDHLDGK